MTEQTHSDGKPDQDATPDAPSNTKAPSQGNNEAAGGVNATADQPASDSPGSPTSPRDQFQQEVAQRKATLDDHEEEESLWSGGYSPKAMIGSWITMVLITIGLLVAAGLVEQLTFGIALIVIVVLWLLVGGNYARRRLGVHYELTSQRFIHKSGLLTRRMDRIEVIDIDDVSYEQGPIQRIFGVGTINITSSDRSDPELDLLGIDKVAEVSGLIDDVRRAERRRRSLHIESI